MASPTPILDVYNVGVTSMRQTSFDLSSPKHFYGYYAFSPYTSFIDEAIGNSWISQSGEKHNQRIWCKFVIPFAATALNYDNYHDGHSPDHNPVTHQVIPWTIDPHTYSINDGAYEGSIWGSNIQPDAYGTYDGLTKLWESNVNTGDVFLRHSPYNVRDTQQIYFFNTTPFLYYIIDINNNHSGNSGIGFRKLSFEN